MQSRKRKTVLWGALQLDLEPVREPRPLLQGGRVEQIPLQLWVRAHSPHQQLANKIRLLVKVFPGNQKKKKLQPKQASKSRNIKHKHELNVKQVLPLSPFS